MLLPKGPRVPYSEVTPRAREGLAKFFETAARLGLLHLRREVSYFEVPA